MSRSLASRPRDLALLLTALLALSVCVFALVPRPALTGLPGRDTYHHALAFAALVLPAAALAPRFLPPLLPLLMGFGVLIEILQPLVGRDGEIRDLVADGAGLVAGLILGFVLRRLGRRIRRRRALRAA